MTDEGKPATEGQEEGVDLEELVGKVLESRGITAERLSILDNLGGLESRISDLFKSSGGGETPAATPAVSFDEGAFMEKVGAFIDEKLKGLPTTSSEKKRPPLRRWLMPDA